MKRKARKAKQRPPRNTLAKAFAAALTAHEQLEIAEVGPKTRLPLAQHVAMADHFQHTLNTEPGLSDAQRRRLKLGWVSAMDEISRLAIDAVKRRDAQAFKQASEVLCREPGLRPLEVFRFRLAWWRDWIERQKAKLGWRVAEFQSVADVAKRIDWPKNGSLDQLRRLCQESGFPVRYATRVPRRQTNKPPKSP